VSGEHCQRGQVYECGRRLENTYRYSKESEQPRPSPDHRCRCPSRRCRSGDRGQRCERNQHQPHREFRPVSDGRCEFEVDQIGQDFDAQHCADAEGDVQRENAGDETQPTRNRGPATQQAVINDRRRYPHRHRVQRVKEREPRDSQKKSKHDLTNVLGTSVGRAGTHSQIGGQVPSPGTWARSRGRTNLSKFSKNDRFLATARG
jgi:hypothetical protein